MTKTERKALIETVRLEAELNANYDGTAFKLLHRIAKCIEADGKHIEAQAAEIARLREAAAEERARIVTWLRNGNAWLNGGECCGSRDSDGVCLAPACEWGEELKALHKVADAIEAGEHMT